MYVDLLKNTRLSAPRMGWTLKLGMLLKTIRPGECQDRIPDVRVLRVSRPKYREMVRLDSSNNWKDSAACRIWAVALTVKGSGPTDESGCRWGYIPGPVAGMVRDPA